MSNKTISGLRERAKFVDDEFKTKKDRITLYIFLAGIIVWIVALPVTGLRGLVLSLLAFSRVLPMGLALRRQRKKIDREILHLEMRLIAHEAILEIFKPDEYKRMIKAREVRNIFDKK